MLVPDQINAAHVDAHAVGGLYPRHLAVVVLAGGDEAARHETIGHTTLRAIHIREKGLKCPDPLRDTGRDDVPFIGAHHPRHDVERKRTLLAGVVKGHALSEIRGGKRLRSGVEVVSTHAVDLGVDVPIVLANVAVEVHRLIPRRGRRVSAPGVAAALMTPR
ncbi:hypothetical protein GCM10025876_04490 [Demequina litorisediminis]|uniref:Uncharacterized protein n=1 Tax=Demequina litorisediminis TaxID=1849022 RepID=A0ABQ6IA81_9MICO|nr:hypothetical protein GCM10025876_04490 [Demequina litorisediminis]